MPIPAVTLQNSTIHSSQNWRVRKARSTLTPSVVRAPPVAVGLGSQPSGFHPGGGTLTVIAPSIMAVK